MGWDCARRHLGNRLGERCPARKSNDLADEYEDRNLRRLNECCNGIVEDGVKMRVPMIWQTKVGANWGKMKDSPYNFRTLQGG